MATTIRLVGRSIAAKAWRRRVALVLLLCVGTSSVEVLFGNEPVTTAPTLADATGICPQAPVPADQHEDEGCPCFCACGCTGAVLTVEPVSPTLPSVETVHWVAEIRTVVRPAHRTTPPPVRPPLA
jgi:hypothetical protein